MIRISKKLDFSFYNESDFFYLIKVENARKLTWSVLCIGVLLDTDNR